MDPDYRVKYKAPGTNWGTVTALVLTVLFWSAVVAAVLWYFSGETEIPRT